MEQERLAAEEAEQARVAELERQKALEEAKQAELARIAAEEAELERQLQEQEELDRIAAEEAEKERQAEGNLCRDDLIQSLRLRT